MTENELRYVKISPEMKDFRQLEELYNTAFPAEERFFTLREAAEYMKGRNIAVEAAAVYDGDRLIGFYGATVNPEKNYKYLQFIATDPGSRGKGYGGKILRKLLEENKDRVFFASIERPEEGEEDFEIKKRRQQFYERNGMITVDCPRMVNGVKFIIVTNKTGEDFEICCANEMKEEEKQVEDGKKLKYAKYLQVLKEELIPAMGCTEPIAVALAAAKARDVLGMRPESVKVEASGSIIKNVKSVIVPHTDHMRGIGAAAAVGIIGGKAENLLNCLAEVTREQQAEMRTYLKKTPITTDCIDGDKVFDIIVTVRAGEHYAKVRIVDYHTNIVYIEKDGEVLLDLPVEDSGTTGETDRKFMNVADIWDFANHCDVKDLEPILEPQVRYNMAISEEGLKNNYGANVGKSILALYGNDIKFRARAAAAAGSDARMNGCEMPVIINSGSGNQGITASVPVVTYARELRASEERMYRALALSNLIAIHQKTGIGTLSAYCGAISAGIGAGCGIAYLLGGDLESVEHTLVNAIVTASGIICDGAKGSCAAKIAIAVEAGINGYYRHIYGNDFHPGDGIVGDDVEDTIANVGDLASEGMKDTNDTIIDIMIN